MVQNEAGTRANLRTLVATEGRGRGRKRSVGHNSVLSSKSGLEGRKPSLHGGVEGRMGVIAVFPGPGCTLCFGTLFLTKSQCSHHINTRRH